MAQRAEPNLVSSGDGHRHLAVVAPPKPLGDSPSWKRRLGSRWAVLGLAVSAAILYLAAFTRPWWSFTLFAPQYPKGLSLTVSLTGLGGDVHEIDMLNHYIGMAHLEDAAQFERRFAIYGVGFLALSVVVLALTLGKKLNALLIVPGVVFPVTFLADSFYWLRRFGHALDPHAPLKIPPFTPQLFGEGKIGQFRTVATPDVGFWMAVVAVSLLVVALFLRWRACGSCAHKDACGLACPNLFVGPGAGLPRKEP
jgi:copper chaperone NosL